MHGSMATNRILQDYDSSETSTLGFCVDANNLFAGGMQNNELPQSDITLIFDNTPAKTPTSLDDSTVVYLLEDNLHYPASSYECHQELAHEKNAENYWLCDYQVNLRED